MLIPFTEPTAPRHIYLNPVTNRLHVLLPVVSGSQIGLDNTCKSVFVLQEFFGKSRDVNQRAVLDELTAYQNALTFDMSLMAEHSELKIKKQERMEQIERYIDVLNTVLRSNVLDSLNQVFPEYPAPLQELMKNETSNLYSMVLRPKELDNLTRSVNPVFSLKRTDGDSVFYQTLAAAFAGVRAAKDARAKLIDSVESSLKGRANNLKEIQDVLKAKTQIHLDIDMNYTHTKTGAPITEDSIAELMMFDEDNPPSITNYIDALLGQCAPTLFDVLIESPFHTIKKPEELSIVTQFFMGSLNIYCRAHGLSALNFGTVLDESEGLSQHLAAMVLSLQNEANIEEALLDFIHEHQESFGLKKRLSSVERAQIKKQFTEQFAEIKESPHFDEFTLLDTTKSGPFLVYQGAICLHFAEFMATGFPELNPDFFATLRDDFKRCQGTLTHNNPSVHASIELCVEELVAKIKDDAQLSLVLKKLPQEQQDAILATPQMKTLQLPKLLHQVARGQQNEAKQLLEDNPHAKLLVHSGEFTDYSGRTFNCSAYEYAYWANDTHMCRMLEKLMDEDTKADMLNRCEAIEAQGLTYNTQHGKEVTSKHFDFTPLKTALQAYIQGYDDWARTKNWYEMMAAWMAVGIAQRDVPAHVAQEYCRRDRSFLPLPQFDEAVLPRTLTFYNYQSDRKEQWFSLAVSNSSGLGVDFALIRTWAERRPRPGASGIACAEGAEVAGRDLAAVSHLDEVRSADLTQSRANLKSVVGEHGLGMSF
jgi:hypothetical protein